MKKVILTIILILVIVASAFAIIFVIKNKPRETKNTESDTVSLLQQKVDFDTLIDNSTHIVSATVIKYEGEGDKIKYTLNVNEMLKGKNFTGLCYAVTNSNTELNIGEKYLFFGKYDGYKYILTNSVDSAKWVFFEEECGSVVPIDASGELEFIDTDNFNIKYIKNKSSVK